MELDKQRGSAWNALDPRWFTERLSYSPNIIKIKMTLDWSLTSMDPHCPSIRNMVRPRHLFCPRRPCHPNIDLVLWSASIITEIPEFATRKHQITFLYTPPIVQLFRAQWRNRKSCSGICECDPLHICEALVISVETIISLFSSNIVSPVAGLPSSWFSTSKEIHRISAFAINRVFRLPNSRLLWKLNGKCVGSSHWYKPG